MSGTDLRRHPLHLGLGATAEVEPRFTGSPSWYEDYAARHAADGAEGRLVSLHRFTEPWDMWEVHPNGAEVVICIDGSMTLIQEGPEGSQTRTDLGPGDYAVNEAGVWHTADVAEQATAIFITSGLGTQHRVR